MKIYAKKCVLQSDLTRGRDLQIKITKMCFDHETSFQKLISGSYWWKNDQLNEFYNFSLISLLSMFIIFSIVLEAHAPGPPWAPHGATPWGPMPLGPPWGPHGPSPGINRAPIARMKMILIPIESLYKNLQF